MPNYFVPLDTTQYTKLHRQLAAKSIILNANLRYVDKNRKSLKRQYPDFATFKQQYEVPQSVIDGILKEGEKQKITPTDDAELQKTLPYLRVQLKALVARDLWDMSEYFSVFNESSDTYRTALKVLKGDITEETYYTSTKNKAP